MDLGNSVQQRMPWVVCEEFIYIISSKAGVKNFHAHSLRMCSNMERDFGSNLCYLTSSVFPSVAQCLRCLPLSIAKGLLLALLDPALPSQLCALAPKLPHSLHPFPLVPPQGCSHAVIPTASPRQTRCCGGGRFSWGGTNTGQD